MKTRKLAKIAATSILGIWNPGFAQEGADTDLSRYQIFEEGEQSATLKQLEAMEDEYRELVDAGDCANALPKIVEFADAANKLANILRQGNEPYYDARSDDQEAIVSRRALLNQLIKAEGASNNLIELRNEAWVEEAKCLLDQGSQDEAITRLYRALDYIGHDSYELWEEARMLLWEQVGFDPEA
jgi:tetratricopeptide (TPR) repeat protein